MRLSESRSSPPYAALLQTAYGALSTQILCVAALLCGDIRSFADRLLLSTRKIGDLRLPDPPYLQVAQDRQTSRPPRNLEYFGRACQVSQFQ